MNRTRLLLGVALALLGLALGTTSFTGGYGFFDSPEFEAQVTLTTPSTPARQTARPEPVQQPCNGKPGPIVYYANDPSAAQYNNFGRPLDPRLSPLDEPRNPKPDTRQMVGASWKSFCHDPARTRAVVGAAFPSWDGLYRQFDWMTALKKLHNIGWGQAQMVYYTDPPTPWTMMMKHNPSGGAPTTYITRSHYAGWYLRVPVDSSHQLLLRVGCGDQPSLDLRKGYAQAALTGIFPIS
jgi:hypothetical protein